MEASVAEPGLETPDPSPTPPTNRDLPGGDLPHGGMPGGAAPAPGGGAPRAPKWGPPDPNVEGPSEAAGRERKRRRKGRASAKPPTGRGEEGSPNTQSQYEKQRGEEPANQGRAAMPRSGAVGMGSGKGASASPPSAELSASQVVPPGRSAQGAESASSPGSGSRAGREEVVSGKRRRRPSVRLGEIGESGPPVPSEKPDESTEPTERGLPFRFHFFTPRPTNPTRGGLDPKPLLGSTKRSQNSGFKGEAEGPPPRTAGTLSRDGANLSPQIVDLRKTDDEPRRGPQAPSSQTGVETKEGAEDGKSAQKRSRPARQSGQSRVSKRAKLGRGRPRKVKPPQEETTAPPSPSLGPFSPSGLEAPPEAGSALPASASKLAAFGQSRLCASDGPPVTFSLPSSPEPSPAADTWQTANGRGVAREGEVVPATDTQPVQDTASGLGREGTGGQSVWQGVRQPHGSGGMGESRSVGQEALRLRTKGSPEGAEGEGGPRESANQKGDGAGQEPKADGREGPVAAGQLATGGRGPEQAQAPMGQTAGETAQEIVRRTAQGSGARMGSGPGTPLPAGATGPEARKATVEAVRGEGGAAERERPPLACEAQKVGKAGEVGLVDEAGDRTGEAEVEGGSSQGEGVGVGGRRTGGLGSGQTKAAQQSGQEPKSFAEGSAAKGGVEHIVDTEERGPGHAGAKANLRPSQLAIEKRREDLRRGEGTERRVPSSTTESLDLLPDRRPLRADRIHPNLHEVLASREASNGEAPRASSQSGSEADTARPGSPAGRRLTACSPTEKANAGSIRPAPMHEIAVNQRSAVQPTANQVTAAQAPADRAAASPVPANQPPAQELQANRAAANEESGRRDREESRREPATDAGGLGVAAANEDAPRQQIQEEGEEGQAGAGGQNGIEVEGVGHERQLAGGLERLRLAEATARESLLKRVAGVWAVEGGLGQWLEKLGLQKYGELLESNEVDEEVLPFLTMEDLKEMGIVAVGARRKLFVAIAQLSDRLMAGERAMRC